MLSVCDKNLFKRVLKQNKNMFETILWSNLQNSENQQRKTKLNRLKVRHLKVLGARYFGPHEYNFYGAPNTVATLH